MPFFRTHIRIVFQGTVQRRYVPRRLRRFYRLRAFKSHPHVTSGLKLMFSLQGECHLRFVSSPILLQHITNLPPWSYQELPSLHPVYGAPLRNHPLYYTLIIFSGIPTMPGGGNHTKQFAHSARTEEAHEATMLVAKALALTGIKVIMDDSLFNEVSALSNHYPPGIILTYVLM